MKLLYDLLNCPSSLTYALTQRPVFFVFLTFITMDSTTPEILHDYSPMLRVYRDGRVERLISTEIAPPPLDSNANVYSKDVIFSQESNLCARLYLPRNTGPTQKLPLIFYFHGGAFCVASAFTPHYHNYVNTLAAEANAIAVSVDYRRAPEHPLPTAYDDSWAAMNWVASHSGRDGPDEWLNRHADFDKVFLTGDSSGANIAHRMAMRCGEERLQGFDLAGMVLAHPHFWGEKPIGNEVKEPAEKRARVDEMWRFVCPTTTGSDDPWINPANDPKLAGLGCKRVLVVVAEKDFMKDRGWLYYEKLREIGWGGEVEIMEAKGEDRVFHLFKPDTENAEAMLKKIVSFIHQDKA